ncbi:MAG: hypothetical protein J5780_06950, partial [Treponema sp.]|nr:hypothetical protein [Treponema sp.]
DVWKGDDFSSSSADFTFMESTATSSTGSSEAGYETARCAEFSLDGGVQYFQKGPDANKLTTITQAALDTEITLTVKSYTRLNRESVKEAVSFWIVSKSLYFEYGSPNRNMQLDCEMIDFTESVSSGNASTQNVTTTVEFKVNTMMVNLNTIAVFIDATKLKDVSGAFVVNGNLNERCGEETDSLVRYILVSEKYGDSHTPTESLLYSYGEDFAPKLDYKKVFDCYVYEDDGKYSLISGSASYYMYSGNSSSAMEKMNVAPVLGKMYRLQTREEGKSEWNDVALTFTYYPDDKVYKTQPVQFETGTKIRVIKTVPSMEEGVTEAMPSNTYGHIPHQSYTDSYTEVIEDTSGPFVSCYFPQENQNYIVSLLKDGDSFRAGTYDYDSITGTQKSFFDVTDKGEGKYVIDLKQNLGKEIKFVSYDDFLVTDDMYNPIPFTLTKKDDDSVVMQLKNRFYSESVFIWVGNGVVIDRNPKDGLYSTKFGIFKDVQYGAASGYVNIYTKY